MQQRCQFTFSIILKACTKVGYLQHVSYIHQRIFKSGFLLDVVVVSTLIDMYGKCESIEKAHKIFDKIHDADIVSWTTMIIGYVQNGYIGRDYELFDKIPHQDAISYTIMIPRFA